MHRLDLDVKSVLHVGRVRHDGSMRKERGNLMSGKEGVDDTQGYGLPEFHLQYGYAFQASSWMSRLPVGATVLMTAGTRDAKWNIFSVY